MSQLIRDFYRVAQERGFSRDFQLRVIQLGDTRFSEDDFVYIKTAILPERMITNHDATFMGLEFRVPGAAQYPGSEGWEVTWHCDEKHELRKKIEAWSRETFNDETSQGNLAVPGVDRLVELHLLNDKAEVITKYKLFGVSIRNLGSVSYNLQGTGELMEFTSSVAYHFWEEAP